MSDLVKEALSPQVLSAMSRSVKGFGSGAGMGGLVGGLGGGVVGVVSGSRQAQEEGGSALSGGLRGLGRGALRGMAAGALAGGAAGAVAPGAAQRLAGNQALTGASHFGQRQVHSLTGVGDAKYVRSIGGGAADAHGRLREANKSLAQAPDSQGRAKAMLEVNKARKSFKASEKSEEMGLTSIPGYAKALWDNPREALKTGIKDQWNSMGPGGKALMFGAPVLGTANELRRSQGSDGDASGKFERAGKVLGVGASGMVAPLSIAGDVAAGGMLSSAFGGAGRFVDRSLARLKARRAPHEEPEPSRSMGSDGYMMSDRAAGTSVEGGV